MPNRDVENEDGFAQLLARGPAAADEAAKALQWIEFRGEPLEGKTGPEGSGSPLPELRLMHFPATEEASEGQAFLEILVYCRQAGVRYVYQETLREPIPSSEYAELLEAREVLQKLRGLIADQRLVEPPSTHSGTPDALPLEDARRLRAPRCSAVPPRNERNRPGPRRSVQRRAGVGIRPRHDAGRPGMGRLGIRPAP